jgi:OmpA-OmpF porin, OOP family
MFLANKKMIALAAPLSLAAGLVLAPMQNASAAEYLSDSQKENVTNSYGECWQVSYGLKNCGDAPAAPDNYSVITDGLFDFDKDTIKPGLANRLDEVASSIAGRDYSTVSVVGHTDSIGSEAYNQGLSERRAQSAANYLISKGVDAGKVSTSGQGESNPVASNETSEGRAQNRRVEVNVN